MSSSLSSLVDNLPEGCHSDKCMGCKSCHDYMVFKNDQIMFKCFQCENNHQKHFNKELIKGFANVYKLYNGDINKFI